MEIINNRQAIAKALNFGAYPCVVFDLATDENSDELFKGCYEAKQVIKVASRDKSFYYFGKPNIYRDSKNIHIVAEPCCLSNRFCYKDLVEMTEHAKAQEIKEGQKVVVVLINSKTKKASYPLLCNTTQVNYHCSTLFEIEGDFEPTIEELK